MSTAKQPKYIGLCSTFCFGVSLHICIMFDLYELLAGNLNYPMEVALLTEPPPVPNPDGVYQEADFAGYARSGITEISRSTNDTGQIVYLNGTARFERWDSGRAIPTWGLVVFVIIGGQRYEIDTLPFPNNQAMNIILGDNVYDFFISAFKPITT